MSRPAVVITTALAVFGVAGAVLTGAGAPPVAASMRCTPPPYYASVGQRHIYAITMATSDSVRAGAGDVELRSDSLSTDPLGDDIHGLLVHVTSIGGPLRDELPAHVDQIVLVPWSWDSMCTPVRWTGVVQWLDPASTNLVVGDLRPEEHWADGIPTLDVRPHLLIRTHPRSALMRRNGGTLRADSFLNVDQLFGLYEAMPRSGEPDLDPYAAVEPIRDWILSHPDLVTRQPAAHIASWALYEAEQTRVRNLDVPALGTYRFTAATGADTVVFHVRTRTDVQAIMPDRPTGDDLANARIPRALGYSLYGTGAATLDSLPADPSAYMRTTTRGHLAVSDPMPGEVVAAVAPGTIGLELGGRTLAALVPVDPAYPAAGTWRFAADGRVTFEHRRTLPDGTEFVLTGERISGDATRVVDRP